MTPGAEAGQHYSAPAHPLRLTYGAESYQQSSRRTKGGEGGAGKGRGKPTACSWIHLFFRPGVGGIIPSSLTPLEQITNNDGGASQPAQSRER